MILSVFKPPLSPVRSEQYPVLSVPARDDTSYYEAMNLMWRRQQTFVNIEHDMEDGDDLVQQLLECPQPNCTFAYMIHMSHLVNLDIAGRVINVMGAHQPDHSMFCQTEWVVSEFGTRLEPIKEGSATCGRTGLGFCKITPTPATLYECHWAMVESEVAQHIQAWHVHWPEVQHWHR